MSDTQDFNRILPLLKNLADNEVRTPDMPVDVAVAEAETMGAAALEDLEKLTAVGMSAELIAELPAAAGTLRVANAKWMAMWGEQKEAQKIWQGKEPEGYGLRDEMVAAMRYALRKEKEGLTILRRIQDGRSQTDMIQDLRNLAELGEKYKEQLEAINMKAEKLEQCREMANELGNLHAKAYVADNAKEAKDIRDRAFTYMRHIMSEILDAAEYIFRLGPDRLDYYYSNYRKRKYRNSRRDETMQEQETVTPVE